MYVTFKWEEFINNKFILDEIIEKLERTDANTNLLTGLFNLCLLRDGEYIKWKTKLFRDIRGTVNETEGFTANQNDDRLPLYSLLCNEACGPGWVPASEMSEMSEIAFSWRRAHVHLEGSLY